MFWGWVDPVDLMDMLEIAVVLRVGWVVGQPLLQTHMVFAINSGV
jgi:hypothetical protein